MPRICGVDIPNDKQLWISLSYIYGIGKSSALKVLNTLGLDPYIKAKDLVKDQVSRLSTYIQDNYKTEGQLKREIASNVQRLREIRCYRGLRHYQGLPVRGQRTKTNARTRKGPRKTIAGKKSIKAH